MVKISKAHHIRKIGVGIGKIRKNPTKGGWKKRLGLPYRIEYEFRIGRELIRDKGIMVLQDRYDIRDGKPKPKDLELNQFGTAPLNSWSVIKRYYVSPIGQRYTTLKKFNSKISAIGFMKSYMRRHPNG